MSKYLYPWVKGFEEFLVKPLNNYLYEEFQIILINEKSNRTNIKFIHPIGYNLNSNSTLLYKNWYELKSTIISEDIYIQKFKLLISQC